MKSSPYAHTFNPLYVLVAGALGVALALALFTWNYPAAGDTTGQAFVSVSPFLVWVFLFALLFCLLAILIVPAWALLFQIFTRRIYLDRPERKRRAGWMLALEGLVLTVIVLAILGYLNSVNIRFDLSAYVPQGHSLRMSIASAFGFLTALPLLMGMLLVHTGAEEVSEKISAAGRNSEVLFPLVEKLLSYRALLQNYLVLAGLITSMVTINTAGLRAILVALNPENELAFPVTNAILYGLTFTLVLLLVYVPAHLGLTETSRKLRDELRPLNSLESLKQDMEQRKALDDLLQTNLGVVQNLRTGLITMAPLAASLLASLFKVNIPL